VNGVFIEDQAKVLSERFDVLVFRQSVYGWRDVLRGRMPTAAGFTWREGIRVYEQKIFLPPRLSLRAAMTYRFARAKAAMVAINRDWGAPEIIHSHVVLPAGWVGARLGRALGVPVVLTEHTGPFSLHLSSNSRRALVIEALRSCAKVIAVSPFLANQIQEVGASVPIDIVGNVIPTRFFSLAEGQATVTSDEAPLRLFSASLLTKDKGYEYLLSAARMLTDSGFTRFELHIGGDGPDMRRLKALIRHYRLQDSCRMLGMLKREEVRDWMQRCDIFVLPSPAETFGVVIGEAMACGKPVVATHCGGADFQVTPETGVLVRPRDADALADGIRKLAAKHSKHSPATIRNAVVARFGEAAFLESITRRYQDALTHLVPTHDRLRGVALRKPNEV
jgi:glycosyltransferase involved in cell wall biosynthesis